MWVHKGSEFYNRLMKSWLQDNNTKMCSEHSKGISVAAERFIRTLKNNSYKHMTSISKDIYTDKLDDIVNKYNKKYHDAIKMKVKHIY